MECKKSILEKGCGKTIYKDDNIRCGSYSGGDRHYCKKCFNKLNKNKKTANGKTKR